MPRPKKPQGKLIAVQVPTDAAAKELAALVEAHGWVVRPPPAYTRAAPRLTRDTASVRAYLQWALEQHTSGVVPEGWWRGVHACAVGMKACDQQLFSQRELDEAREIKRAIEAAGKAAERDAADSRMGVRRGV